MSKKKNTKKSKHMDDEMVEQEATLNTEDTTQSSDEATVVGVDAAEQAAPTAETTIEKLQEQLAAQKKEYLFLMADFDNFRKRTLQEKSDLIRNGASRAMLELLPVVDDFERAIAAIDKTDDMASLKEGVELIYNKFVKYLAAQHVKAIESTGQPFDAELHEAITMFPAPSEDMKGKVVDTTLKGYMINDKVLRHAKVVVGQ